jgi:hypothetical protein
MNTLFVHGCCAWWAHFCTWLIFGSWFFISLLFMILGMGWVWCINRSKDHHMIAHCLSCREYRGRHIHRGSHSSSHDSRRRYLSIAYLEKSPTFEERAQRNNFQEERWSQGEYVRCIFNITSEWYPLFKRGEIIQRKIKGTQTGGASPRRGKQGEQSQKENGPLPLMSKGES